MAKGVERPFLLAGGLNSENVEEAITQIQSTRYSEKGHPDKQSSFIGVDVSSGVENTGGGKNYSKMRLFIDKVRGKE